MLTRPLLLLALLVTACSSNDTEDEPMCGLNGQCPTGFTCNPVTQRCFRNGADAALADACVAGTVSVAVMSPGTFACHDPYKATVMLTNPTCAAVTIQEIRLTAMVTAGACAPAGAGTYQPKVASVASGQTATVLDLTAGPFCCKPGACPATYQCDERFDFEVRTSAGNFTGNMPSHLSLDGCGEICP